MKEFSLHNEIALITGGATGIGLGIAQAFIQAGARVILTSRNEEQLKASAQKLGAQAEYRIHDITAFGRSEAFVEQIEQEIGPISILVNNAGNHQKKPSEEVSTEDFRKILDVHVLGAHKITVAVGKRMITRGHGSILFIASMASLFGIPQVVAYSTAKAGYLGMTRALATEWGPKGVRVNAIAPGWIDSEMTRKAVGMDPERRDKILGRTPLGTFGQAEDVGWAAAFLSSSAAKFITGVCLPVDGGAAIGF
jgi:NAD(P)-dependent dehydrogenase (short-subunit alcohol dehydrogenase family)